MATIDDFILKAKEAQRGAREAVWRVREDALQVWLEGRLSRAGFEALNAERAQGRWAFIYRGEKVYVERSQRSGDGVALYRALSPAEESTKYAFSGEQFWLALSELFPDPR